MDTYEKKYKEALEKARQLCAYPTSKPFISDLQDLFPELTESNDERIRKELIDAILGLWDNDALPMPLSVKRKDEWIAWLEKQGKKEPKEAFIWKHWQDVRERAAIAAMQTLIAELFDGKYLFANNIAICSVEYADALVEQLNKK